MADVLWGLWMRLRVGSAKLQRWAFTIGKWTALAFILIYVVGFMAAVMFEALGIPEVSRPLLEFIGMVNEAVRGFAGGS